MTIAPQNLMPGHEGDGKFGIGCTFLEGLDAISDRSRSVQRKILPDSCPHMSAVGLNTNENGGQVIAMHIHLETDY